MIQIQIHFSPTLFGLFSFNTFSSFFPSPCSYVCELFFFNILIQAVAFCVLYIRKNIVWETETYSL